MAEQSVVMVVGASRGLGLALAEEWLGRGAAVIATARGQSQGLDALQRRYPDRLTVESVDINDAEAVHALRARLEGRRLDVLFVNAGIALEIEKTPVQASERAFLDMMLTNAFSPVRAVEVLDDLVARDGVIALMTSGLGSIANATGGWQLYSASKAALNMLIKGYAGQHAQDGRALLLMAPGWVRTDMGGAGATLSIEESIPKVVDTVEANRGKPGLRYVDRFNKPLPW